jgi:hypothetical protein
MAAVEAAARTPPDFFVTYFFVTYLYAGMHLTRTKFFNDFCAREATSSRSYNAECSTTVGDQLLRVSSGRIRFYRQHDLK